MRRSLWGAACACLMTGYCASAEPPMTAAAPDRPVISGIDIQYIDDSVRPQDDFYQYVNGKWLAATEIPADKSSYGTQERLTDAVEDQLRGILEGLQKSADPADPDQRKIADLYSSFMDEAAADRLGLTPLAAEFAKIDALTHRREIASLIARFNRIGVTAPFAPAVHQDARDSTRYVVDLRQSGLGLPDRDYYLQDEDRLKHIRAEYRRHVEKMLTLAGDKHAAGDAQAILELETALAGLQWTRVENRDPVKIYNRVEVGKLAELAPGYDWKAYLAASGAAGRTDYVVVGQPSYVTGFSKLLRQRPLPVWKAYFRWCVINDFAPYLGKKFVDEHFAFYGTVLRGAEQNMPRWKRGIGVVNGAMGQGLGKIYVARFFPPESKARMDELVKNLLAAYRADIGTLDWMGPETKHKAQDKLAKFTVKIGYPAKWRDYSALRIVKGDLVGNVIRAEAFEYDRNLHKLGQPIDRTEWHMTPQTINAYNNPEQNEIVFPAAYLQPPLFNAAADDAVNYGGIGTTIGHEISHGFDDRGSQYDGDGNLLSTPGWFTPADLERFKAKTHALVAQYSACAPVPGYPVNGELTLGENIADNSGVAIAYKAYKLSLGGQPAPVIDGLTGEQRFFMGWAQKWRGKMRDGEAILRIKSDPHSPRQFRGTLPEMNQAAFYEAFGVKEGDKMYLPPESRVTIW